MYLLTTIHDRYKEFCERGNKFDLYPTFVFEVAKFRLLIHFLLADVVSRHGEMINKFWII